jgi:hypothetical protein
MENKALYIKYLDNQPVKVETHYNGEQERRRPLTDVGDLVAGTRRLTVAFFPAADPVTLGQYTLHSVVDGVAIPGLVLRDKMVVVRDTDTIFGIFGISYDYHFIPENQET